MGRSLTDAFPSPKYEYLKLIELKSALDAGNVKSALSLYNKFQPQDPALLNQAKVEFATYYFKQEKIEEVDQWGTQVLASEDEIYTEDILILLIKNALREKKLRGALNFYGVLLSRYPEADESKVLWNQMRTSSGPFISVNDAFYTPTLRLNYLRNLVRGHHYERALEQANVLMKTTEGAQKQEVLFLAALTDYHLFRLKTAETKFLMLSREKKLTPVIREQALFYLGRCLELNGKYKAAEQAYAAVLNVKKGDPDWEAKTYYYLAMLHFKVGTFNQLTTSKEEFKQRFGLNQYYDRYQYEEKWRENIRHQEGSLESRLSKLFTQKSISDPIWATYKTLSKRSGIPLSDALLDQFPLPFAVMKLISDYQQDMRLSNKEKESIDWLIAMKLDGVLKQQMERYRYSEEISTAYLYANFKLNQDHNTLYEKVAVMDNALIKADQKFQVLPRIFIQEAYPRPYGKEVSIAVSKFKIDPNLIWTLMKLESQFNPYSGSKSGGFGLIRLSPEMGKEMSWLYGRNWQGNKTLLSPEKNIYLSAAYLSLLLKRYNQDVFLTVLAYKKGRETANTFKQKSSDKGYDAMMRSELDAEFKAYLEAFLKTYLMYTFLSTVS